MPIQRWRFIWPPKLAIVTHNPVNWKSQRSGHACRPKAARAAKATATLLRKDFSIARSSMGDRPLVGRAGAIPPWRARAAQKYPLARSNLESGERERAIVRFSGCSRHRRRAMPGLCTADIPCPPALTLLPLPSTNC
jgi:hypothetical protein